MKIFVSWSGEKSRGTAESLRSWLILLFPSLSVWVSSKDVNAGDRWHETLTSELDDTDFGIICLNEENTTSAWLLYEAGALAKSLNQGRVVPLLSGIEISDLPDPLKHFQAVKENRSGLRDIVQSISVFLPDNQRKDSDLDLIFDLLFEQFGIDEDIGASLVNVGDANLPTVEFLKTNGLIIKINQQPVTLTEREYVAYFFLCLRGALNQPSFPYYKAVPGELDSWLRGSFGAALGRGVGEWIFLIEERGGFLEFQRTMSSLRKKFSLIGLAAIQENILPQRGRIGVNVRLVHDLA